MNIKFKKIYQKMDTLIIYRIYQNYIFNYFMKYFYY